MGLTGNQEIVAKGRNDLTFIYGEVLLPELHNAIAGPQSAIVTFSIFVLQDIRHDRHQL